MRRRESITFAGAAVAMPFVALAYLKAFHVSVCCFTVKMTHR